MSLNIPQLVGQSIRPPQRLSLVEWADENRILPATSAEPGRWRTDRTPYMREPMEALTPGSGVRSIALMFPAQMSKTELILNGIGHSIDIDPGPALIVQPTDSTARSWSQKRLAPMIESTPKLRELFGDSRRNPKNKALYKEFPGGFLRIGFATSAAELASDPIRDVWGDEVDKWPGDVDGEGDPVELCRARTRTFSDRRREVWTSTPSIKGRSRIERMYLAGDQRQYHLPCPACGDLFAPELEMLERQDDGSVACKCPSCFVAIDESHKADMLENGEWIAQNPECDPSIRSYHISGLCSPPGWLSWRDVLDKYEQAVADDEAGDENALQVFWNSVLGLPFEKRRTEATEWNRLYERAGGVVLGEVPLSVALLTAGVDVQGDRLEIEVLGWGRRMRSWSIEYLVLPGRPDQPEVWEHLDEIFYADWPGEGGAVYQISRLAIDTGYLPDHVHTWARGKGTSVMPVKGSTRQSRTIGTPSRVDVTIDGRSLKRGGKVWPINVNNLKDTLVNFWLQQPYPEPNDDGELIMPSGWSEWPHYPPEYFKGLLGEQLVPKGNSEVWDVVYKDQEPLDCRVYNMASAYSLRLHQWKDEDWERALVDVKRASRDGEEVATRVRKPRPSSEEEKKKPKRRYTDSSWLKR